MIVNCVWEHNGCDSLLYASNFIGAFTRGKNLEVALEKMQREVLSYLRWKGDPLPLSLEIDITQEKSSGLQIRDADSDVIFVEETRPLTLEEYTALKALALKSANDFLTLYSAIPVKDCSCLSARSTFYGQAPRTAREMYEHTKNVNAYYFGEVGVDADNDGTITECRERGFQRLEELPDFLKSTALEGSYGEQWSARKVLRRFLWHDRIHAKAMYRMAVKTFGPGAVPNVFAFDIA